MWLFISPFRLLEVSKRLNICLQIPPSQRWHDKIADSNDILVWYRDRKENMHVSVFISYFFSLFYQVDKPIKMSYHLCCVTKMKWQTVCCFKDDVGAWHGMTCFIPSSLRSKLAVVILLKDHIVGAWHDMLHSLQP